MKMTHVVSVDVGTTYVKGYVVDRKGNVVGNATEKVKLPYPCRCPSNTFLQLAVQQPRPGWAEIEPEGLWSQFQDIVKASINSMQHI